MADELVVRQQDETQELVQMAFEEVAGAFEGLHSIHGSIAGRVFQCVGGVGAPVHWAHDRISGAVYGGLKGSVVGMGRVAGTAVGRRPRVVSNTPRGAALVATINGLIGDTLDRRQSALSQPMALRVHGEPLAIDRESLREAYPAATPRIAVFLHGLMETEFSWRWGSRETGDTYAELLERELGLTSVYVRYNSGLRISENGRALADLIDQVVAAWPV